MCRGVDPFDRRGRLTEPRRLDGDVDAKVTIGALALQRAHVAVEHHPSPIDQRDRLAEILDEVELMAREQHVASIRDVVEHDLRQELHGARIESGERLVEHDQVGPVDHRRRELHPLRHPSRQVADRVASAVLEPRAVRAGRVPAPVPRACRARAAERSTRGGRPRACRGTALAPGACSPTTAGRRRSPGRPFHSIVPSSGSSTPKMIRINVVLPAPFGPSRPITLPAGTSRSTSSSTTRSPNRWDTPRTTSESVIPPPCHPASFDVQHRRGGLPNRRWAVTYGEMCA